ncbi:PhnD/SsuA/transferrin family substrate-binding protein [Selenomonas artemidis]|uniref:Phosphate/phosphite/phosphonate ABC transporter, periplasmic binding protein n=1 Tax=Selenomonas artemidis F0399 TaxID=749551 RepID=E7N543_9FIRM|nr:PhnD/SsuA/transferrin family substrate-binding protein [Selenomonas artemidis]EFW28696.1 phosphate/phosphite/phosphonate ABC transporter, periplasmic binding protein [Selenomonas artemidis F0399]
MRVRQYIFVGAVLAVLAAVLVHTLSEERIQVYFDRVEAIPGYKIELREQPLRIAMISVLNHQTTDEYQHAMVRSIGRLLGRPVLLLHRRSYAEINQLLARGDADVAFLSSGAYMVYGKKEDVRLLAMPERDGANRYFSYIIVPRTSPAQALSDLRGRRFVYVDPLSYSGYIELRARLRTMGEDPEHFFGSYYFTYSHDDSLRAVADGLVDGGVIASLTYDYYRVNAPAILDKIRLLEAMPGSGMGPIVARRDLRDADAVQEILLHLSEDAEAKEAMQHLLIDRFVPPQPELYPQFSPEEGI